MATEKKTENILPEDGASEEVCNMTREEALDYLGLPKDADKEDIEKRFWQLSKNYRTQKGDDAEQKITDLSAAYDIATGNRDLREEAAKAREKEKKFLGKTKAEWKNYVSYSWKYYVAAVVFILGTAYVVYSIFFKPAVDCGIISIGNFEHSEEYYDQTVRKLGYKYPSLLTYCYIAVSEDGQQADIFTNQAAVTSLYSGTNVIVTDKPASPYFFEYQSDCTDLYKALADALPAETYAKITPVYMSEREYKKLITEFRRSKGYDMSSGEVDYSSYSDAKIMTGLLIEDEEMIKKLGYKSYWHNQPASVVISMNVLTKDQTDTVSIITAILLGL
jgi:hypothetical protein